MSRLKLWVGIFFFSAFAVAGPAEIDRYHQWITSALEKAFRGDLESPTMGVQMREVFAKSSDASQRATAAYLLTLDPKLAKPYSMDELTDAALSHPDPTALLGPQAHARLLRTRADRLYNAGKFEAAEVDFIKIAELSKGVGREYALLKRGWCIFNRNQPGEAFKFWSETLRNASGELHASSTWFHSLGQALAENRDRTEADAQTLSSLCREPQQKSEAIDGVLEGAESLLTYADLSKLASTIHSEDWYAQLVDRIAAARHPKGRDACLALSWMQADSRQQFLLPGHLEVVESCFSWTDSTEVEVQNALMEVAPRLELRADQRRVRVALYSRAGQEAKACVEGLDWLQDTEAPKDFPGVEVARACRNSGDRTAAERAAELAIHRAMNPELLKGTESVYPYLYSELFREPVYREVFFDAWKSAPERFHGTDLPQLLAERCLDQDEMDRTAELFKHEGVDRDPQKASVWNRIAERELDTSLEKSDVGESYAVLLRTFPLSPQRAPLGPERAAWGKWLMDCKAHPDNRSRCEQGLDTFLAAVQGPVQDFALFIDLGIEFDRYPAILGAMERITGWEKLPREVRSRAEDKLFAHWMETAPATDPKAPKSVLFVAHLAERLRAGEFREAVQQAPVGDSAVAQDLAEARRLESSARKTLRTTQKRPLLTQIPAWVGYLKKELPRTQKRSWSHPKLSELGFTSVREFCAEASSQLKKTPQASLEPQWKQAYHQLETRFEDCRSAEGGPRT